MPDKDRRPDEEVILFRESLAGNSFDWYLSEYGFEGKWRNVHAALLATECREEAAILEAAATLHERYLNEVFDPANGQPTPEQEDPI